MKQVILFLAVLTVTFCVTISCTQDHHDINSYTGYGTGNNNNNSNSNNPTTTTVTNLSQATG